ncbi:MAG: calcium-binding EGF-like domain-containing protein, partial [Myxococcota bacterium]|nr:calcium-binding EGF-like domain-containing protein [Myxococcota bacterium]
DVLVIGTLQGRFSLEQQQVVEWLLDMAEVPVVHVILGVPFDYFQTRDRVQAALAVMGSRSVMVEAAADVLYGQGEARGTMLYELSGAADAVSATAGAGTLEDRCETEGIVCAGEGVCVDTGVSYGCLCHPNWHPSDDGLDCIPDGQ